MLLIQFSIEFEGNIYVTRYTSVPGRDPVAHLLPVADGRLLIVRSLMWRG